MIKIGRNEPCPCGSGTKYKKCCLGKAQSASASILRLAEAETAAARPVTAAAGQAPDLAALAAAVMAPAVSAAASTSGSPALVRPEPEDAAPAAQPAEKLTLPKLKKKASKEMTWAGAQHEQVALELIEAMKDYDNELILEALVLWNGFSRATRPVVKKAGSFFAAIELYLSAEYGLGLTQAEAARKYEVTPGTVARKSKDLAAYIEEYGTGELSEDLETALSGEPKDRAALLLRRAAGASSAKRRTELARQALELYPDSVDAYLVLAEEAEHELDARSFLKAGMEAGERELGEAFFKEHLGHFWQLNEARPYLRISWSYAESCWFGGQAEEAALTLARMLELDAGDALGARYLLTAAYLYSGRLEEAAGMLDAAGDDVSAAYAYDRIVLEFKRSGVTANLKMLYRVARNVNRHVPDYLLGVKMLPHSLPEYAGTGDTNEAVQYVIMHSRLWAGTPELLKWMLQQQ